MNAYVERQQLTGSHFITVLHLSAVSGRLNMRHDLVDRRQKLVKIITIFILWSERRSLGGRQGLRDCAGLIMVVIATSGKMIQCNFPAIICSTRGPSRGR